MQSNVELPLDRSDSHLTPRGTEEDAVASHRIAGRPHQEPLERKPRLLGSHVPALDVGDCVGEDLSPLHG